MNSRIRNISVLASLTFTLQIVFLLVSFFNTAATADDGLSLSDAMANSKELAAADKAKESSILLQTSIIKAENSPNPDLQMLAEASFQLSELYKKLDDKDAASQAFVQASAYVEKAWASFDAKSHGGGSLKSRGIIDSRLVNHVVNTGADGLLSHDDQFQSTPLQIDRLFKNMEIQHDKWIKENKTNRRRILLYAHGGLTPERNGLKNAERHLNFWLANGIYPINFVWESGLREVLRSRKSSNGIDETSRGDLPFGLRNGNILLSSSLVEKVAHKLIKPVWDSMKDRALQCSAPLKGPVDWSSPDTISTNLPGASLTIDRLKKYVEDHPGEVEISIAGHSAGGVFSVGLLQRIQDSGLKVKSLALLAPALRVCDYEAYIAPRVQSGLIGNLMVLDLSAPLEESDVSSIKGIAYPHSLLFLVSRALETPGLGESSEEVPLVGMSKFSREKLTLFSNNTFGDLLAAIKGVLVESNVEGAPGSLISTAKSHGGFADDPTTMDSVAFGITGLPVTGHYSDLVTK